MLNIQIKKHYYNSKFKTSLKYYIYVVKSTLVQTLTSSPGMSKYATQVQDKSIAYVINFSLKTRIVLKD